MKRFDKLRQRARKGQAVDLPPPPHLCGAIGCTRRIPRRLLMCRDHWLMVPMEMRERIWNHYAPGQELPPAAPSAAYLQSVADAINHVWRKENAAGKQVSLP